MIPFCFNKTCSHFDSIKRAPFLFKFKNVFPPNDKADPPPMLAWNSYSYVLLCTLLWIQHSYALEYDKPCLIQHYIQIFNVLVFSRSSHYAAHLHFLWDFRNRYGFFADSKYVNFNKKHYFFYFFLIYLLSWLLNSKNTLLVFRPYLFRFSTILKTNCMVH